MAKLTSVKFLDSGSPPHIVTLTLLAGVTSLNLSILLPSLAEMTDYFGTQYAIMMLSVSGYLAATTIVQIAVGPISDTYGRRPVVLALLVLFVLATIGAYFATSVEVFLTFRMLQ
ncbi:MAG: MFS transporter, partial [Rhodobacteraceae bacterium]|nr:MFS transporter [Paracoccaceae bacterium]